MFRRLMATRHPSVSAVIVLFAVSLMVAACGDTSPSAVATTSSEARTTTPETTTPETTATTVVATTTTEVATATTFPAPVEITVVDHEWKGLPAVVPLGTSFTLVNESTSEYHVIGFIKLAESDTRSLEEYASLLPGEIFASAGALRFGTPQAILGARPGEGTSYTWGSPSLYTPGRYLLIDAVPVGADPTTAEAELEEYKYVFQIEDVDAHYQRGEIAVVIVEE